METIKLDLVPGKKMPSLHASQFDDGRAYHIDLTENKEPYKLDGTEVLTVNERKGDNNICSLDIENTFADKTYVEFASTLQMCAVAGANICELVITKGDVKLGTLNFILEIEPSPTEGGIESESEISNLERQIREITEEVIGDDYYTAEQTDEAIANATEGKADTTYVNTELAKKADKTDTYTKVQVDNALNNKMDKANPTGTGSFSLNRKANTTIGYRSVATGYNTTASGMNSHSEGVTTTSSGMNSHSEGATTTASGSNSHSEGFNTTASGNQAHSEGTGTIASGNNSHSEGAETTASGERSHAEGLNTEAKGNNQHVSGKYNIVDNNDEYAEIIGNGTSEGNRSNARTLDWQGNETLAGDVIINGNQSVSGEITRLDGRIDDLPAPMIFKGTLGVGGTIQTLPTASAENEGWMFKCITAGTYAGLTLKVGDTVTCFNPPNTSTYYWDKTGSQDTDTDTWRNIKVNGVEKLGNGISSGAVDFVGSENIEVDFDGNGNKVGVKTKNIYTKEQVDDIVYNILPDDTASGSVANFETSLEMPIKSLEVDVNAVQSAGTPTPETPLPISGRSEINLYQLGGNFFNKNTVTNGKLINGSGNEVSYADWNISDFIPVVEGASYYLYGLTTHPNTNQDNFELFDENKNKVGYANVKTNEQPYVIPSGVAYIKCCVKNPDLDTAQLGVSVNASFVPYNPTLDKDVINLGGIYYGGHFTQDKEGHRQFVVTHEITDLGELTWGYSVWGAGSVFSANIPAAKDQAVSGVKGDIICSIYNNVSASEMYNSNPNYSMCLNRTNVRIANSDYSNKDAFKTAMSGIMLVYPLETPIIIDLPDGEPIITLNGTNNIYADTGDTEVVFKCSVNDYVSAHSGGNLLGMGGVYLGGAKSGGGEEEPDEGEDTEKAKLDDPKEEIKTIGDTKKIGGE